MKHFTKSTFGVKKLVSKEIELYDKNGRFLKKNIILIYLSLLLDKENTGI
jgi:hypothetical protein